MFATTAGRWPGPHSSSGEWPREWIEEALSRFGAHRRRHMAHHFGRHGGPGPRPGHGRRGFGGPPFAWGWGAGPGRRSRRGDVRVAVLTLLSEEPMHGYQIITELTERSGGTWRPSPGSVYPTLQQLEDERLVSVSEEDGRRTYALTDAGRHEVARLAKDRRAPWEEMAEGAAAGGSLRSTAFQVMAAAMQVAMAGNDQQAARAERILGRTRRDLYRLLAEDDDSDDSDDETTADPAGRAGDPTGDATSHRAGGGGEGTAR